MVEGEEAEPPDSTKIEVKELNGEKRLLFGTRNAPRQRLR